MGHSSLSVSLPPSLPHLNWWLQPIFNSFCPWKSVSSDLPQSAVASTFPSPPSSPWTHSDSPQLPHCLERPRQSWKCFKRLSSCGTSSPAVCVCEGRVCQPAIAVCNDKNHQGTASWTPCFQSVILESSTMFRKYFIHLCGVGAVSVCPPNWSWDAMTLYITKDN